MYKMCRNSWLNDKFVPLSSFLSVVSYNSIVNLVATFILYLDNVQYIENFLTIMKVKVKVTISKINQHMNFTWP